MRSRPLSLAGTLLLAGSLSLQAQGGQAGTAQEDAAGTGAQGAVDATRGARQAPAVFTGCIQRVAEALGMPADTAGMQFVLADASPGSAGSEDRTLGTATGTGGLGSSPTAPPSGSTADTTASGAGSAGRATPPAPPGEGVDGAAGRTTRQSEMLGLSAAGDRDLSRYVGQRVEVRGRFTDGALQAHRDSGIAARTGESENSGSDAETMSPRPSAGVETGAAGTAGTTGDTRGRAATTTPAGTSDDHEPAGLAAFEVESVRVIGGVCESDR